MNLNELQQQALAIQQKYRQYNAQKGQTPWSVTDYTSGFVGDVGDLVKLVMAKQGLRDGKDIDEKIAHELSDCLWSILVIANELGINIEENFIRTMEELDKRLAS